MTATVKKVERVVPDLAMKAYVPAILEGLGVTTRHFVQNLGNLVSGRKKSKRGTEEIATIRYPDEKREYPPRYRGHHRLMRREDDQVRCVACFMCSTACPANCIYIEAGEHEDPTIEKFPVRFDIDHLVCIYCGMCEEACPCDAIRMDSGEHTKPKYSRTDQRVHLVDLLERGGPSIAKQGGRFS
ncbi:MAG: NADH-quinone oxidoreductase subunit I [Myxococcales bacterium]|nr:NADH-quinone oxidoreductase subunit I [Myxococcales bacterium]|tara:strand:+ start:901 stop:1455 length:555 start_codon:yes stop_codon:yes gene_type:complete